MVRAGQILRPAEIERVNRAVAAAKARCGVHVLPVVTTTSGNYPRAEDTVGLITAILALTLFYGFFHHTPQGRSWSLYQEMRLWGMLSIIGAAVMGFVAGTLMTAHVAPLRRLFVSHRKKRRTVRHRAHQTFNDAFTHAADADRNHLVLIFVSLFERRVELVTTPELAPTLPPPQREALLKPVLAGSHSGDLHEGLVEAIEHLAQALDVGPDPQSAPTTADHLVVSD